MLTVHFLNVGHGDCTIIKHHSGRLTVVDINNSQSYDSESLQEFIEERRRLQPRGLRGIGMIGAASNNYGLGMPSPPRFGVGLSSFSQAVEELDEAKRELTDPIVFLKTEYPGEVPFRFILTHPDLDHMRGISKLYETVGFTNFWDTRNTKPTPTYRSNNSVDREDWEFYQKLRSGNVPRITPRFFARGDSLYAFGKDESGNAGGDNISILSPTPALVDECNACTKSNDLSIVLWLGHAGRSVLLPGDAEDSAWCEMVRYYGQNLKCDFLKASHHGRDSGYHLAANKIISPLITFVSVGRKPDTDASSKYKQFAQRVASTRYHGNIRLSIFDDGTYKWTVERNAG